MNTVLLSNDGEILESGRVISEGSLRYLNHRIELETGQTLRSYFLMLDRYASYQKLNPFLTEYMDAFHGTDPAGCKTDEFDHLELNKCIEMIGFPGEPRLEIFSALEGVSGDRTCTLSSAEMACLLDMPIRLGHLKHVIFGDSVYIFRFDTIFNLFEYIDTIAWELSFQRKPVICQLRR
jgi:hypothetical protein